MKKTINQYLLGCVLFLMAASVSCKKDEGSSHDPSLPISVEKFIPATGGGGTEILISGSNFTTDTSQIAVSLNGKPLKVVAANEKQIMVVVPKKAGSGPISVTIGGKIGKSTTNFTYAYTRTVTTLAGSGIAGFANGQGADAMFNFSGEAWYRSSGIVVDDNLNVYVADPGNHCIRKIDPAGNVTTLAGSPNNSGYADGKGTAARFSLPYALTLDAVGNIFCADPGNWDIRKISPDGTATTWAWGNQAPWSIACDKKTGHIYYTSNSSPANVYKVSAQWTTSEVISGINYPAGIVFDNKGNLYVSVNGDQVIRKYDAGTWNSSTFAGQQGSVGWVDGPGASSKFAYPWGLGIDLDNNLYVAGNGTWDGGKTNPDQSIRLIDANTQMVSTFAGSNTAAYADGIGKAAAFSAPGGVTVDKNGTVYVLDKNNNRIRKIVSE